MTSKLPATYERTEIKGLKHVVYLAYPYRGETDEWNNQIFSHSLIANMNTFWARREGKFHGKTCPTSLKAECVVPNSSTRGKQQ